MRDMTTGRTEDGQTSATNA